MRMRIRITLTVAALLICRTAGDSDDDIATLPALGALSAGGDGNCFSCMAGFAALKALIGGFDDSDAGIEVGDDFNFRSFMKGIDNDSIAENDSESKFGVTKQQSVNILQNVLEATGQKAAVTTKKKKQKRKQRRREEI